jgi:hypothetical protein
MVSAAVIVLDLIPGSNDIASILRDVTPCSVVDGWKRLDGTYCFHLQGEIILCSGYVGTAYQIARCHAP